jgi:adenylate kinase
MSIFGDSIPKVIMLFGAPGAGKGTVGSMLCTVGNHYHLSSGDIFRNLDPESEQGKMFHEYSSKGQLVPDELTIEICSNYIKELITTKQYRPEEQMLLLDGLPRTVSQAKILGDAIDVQHIIVLDIHDEEEIVRRLSRRASIEGRKDDTDVAIIRQRIDEYRAKTVDVLSYYPKNIVRHYNADLTPVEVLRDVLVGSAHALIMQ